MSEVTPENMRLIAREEIAQHEKSSEKILEAELGMINEKLKEIQDSMKDSGKEDRDYDKRLLIVEGKIKSLFAWKDNQEQAPDKKLNKTATVIGIIATIFSLLTSAAMIAVFKALTALGNKI